MPQTQYNLHLKGFIGGADFDRNYVDYILAFAPSKHGVGTVFSANNIPPHRNFIVFDDFVTTGQTLVSMKNLLVSLGKNCTFFAGINNKL